MSYKAEMIDGKPILVLTLNREFVGSDFASAAGQVEAILNTLTTPVFNIVDTLDLSLSFDDIVQGANFLSHSSHQTVTHPMVIETLVVSDKTIIQMAAKGVSAPVFGGVKLRVFSTLEQALAYCDQQIAQRATV